MNTVSKQCYCKSYQTF